MSRNPQTPRGQVRALISAMRPVQWVKNVLIGIAPAAAGQLHNAGVLRHTGAAFVSFCALSSAIYILNDLRDIGQDRLHPKKQYRAIASGELSKSVAYAASLVLAVIAFTIPFAIWHPQGLLLILGLYFVISISYTLFLKQVPVLEFGAVASGFFLRAYAGAVASHIFVSTWFLVVISFGALFLVTGKRSSELQSVGVSGTRKVLSEYTPQFLHSALTMCATVVVTGYCLWAFDTSSTGLSSVHHNIVPIRLTVIPVVFAILFIMRSASAGNGQSPEDLVLHDRVVQVLGLIWIALVYIGIYG